MQLGVNWDLLSQEERDWCLAEYVFLQRQDGVGRGNMIVLVAAMQKSPMPALRCATCSLLSLKITAL